MSRRPGPASSGHVPPCSAFLGNIEPIIKDGRVVFRNENRVYCFISVVPASPTVQPNPLAPIGTGTNTTRPFVEVNLQVSLATFIIGLFVNRVQAGLLQYDPSMPIHLDARTNEFIHRMLSKPPRVNVDAVPKLSLLISNSNAILPLLEYSIGITPLNFYILFSLNRLEQDPGLLFGNNSWVTADPVNFTLAELSLLLP